MDELSADAYIKAIKKFEKADYTKLATNAHASAKKYSEEIFKEKISTIS